MDTIDLTGEMAEVLKEYTNLQQQEISLRKRKQELQEKLKTHLRNTKKRQWFPQVDGERLKVSYRCVQNISYNEETLSNRLGDQYTSILEPDLRKLKEALPNLDEALKPLLGRIGSPSPDKIKSAIESGLIEPSAFKGAFTRETKEYISVAHIRPD